MDINLDDLTNATHSCFMIQNFCEIHRELINPQYVTATLKYDSEFQPPTQGRCKINSNERNGKKASIYVKYFT